MTSTTSAMPRTKALKTLSCNDPGRHSDPQKRPPGVPFTNLSASARKAQAAASAANAKAKNTRG
eukprot:CAMPEP_0183574324 /NCGR_PEP_ID=MMETSP0371-20130417/133130_1 /TAXON_ID=268820 /ORGANISM="Peridinium aciculiferum, Strain PAER-2" /LENGTH=63 /DNA_ID=CAMNT_0025784387 /DNA_START=338 /DNA_END=526 /DNA_ORIENTATION=+